MIIHSRLGTFCATVFGIGGLVLLAGATAQAGDDPSIKGKLRTNIQASMNGVVETQSVNGKIRLYDPVDDKLLELQLENLHSGIGKKGDFYVSCADFRDQDDRLVDVDFLVIPKGGELLTTQAIVHAVDGKKRKYQLED